MGPTQQCSTHRHPHAQTAIDSMVQLTEEGLLTRAHQDGYEAGLMRGFRIGVLAASALVGVTAALVLVGRWWS